MSKFTPMESAKLSATIDGIAKSAGKLRDIVQKAAVNVIYQSLKHRNVTPANQLFTATAKGLRRDALVRFLEQNGNLAFIKAEKGFKFYEAFESMSDDELAEYCDELMTIAWEEAKPEKIDSIFDVAEMVEKVIKKAEKAAKDAQKVEHAELLGELKGLMRKFNAAQYSGLE